MNLLRDEFLARPRFAENQDARIGWSDQLNLLKYVTQRRALAYDVTVSTRFRNFLAQVGVLQFELPAEGLDFLERTRVCD